VPQVFSSIDSLLERKEAASAAPLLDLPSSPTPTFLPQRDLHRSARFSTLTGARAATAAAEATCAPRSKEA